MYVDIVWAIDPKRVLKIPHLENQFSPLKNYDIDDDARIRLMYNQNWRVYDSVTKEILLPAGSKNSGGSNSGYTKEEVDAKISNAISSNISSIQDIVVEKVMTETGLKDDDNDGKIDMANSAEKDDAGNIISETYVNKEDVLSSSDLDTLLTL